MPSSKHCIYLASDYTNLCVYPRIELHPYQLWFFLMFIVWSSIQLWPKCTKICICLKLFSINGQRVYGIKYKLFYTYEIWLSIIISISISPLLGLSYCRVSHHNQVFILRLCCEYFFIFWSLYTGILVAKI